MLRRFGGSCWPWREGSRLTVEVGMPFWVDILVMSSDSLVRWHFSGDGDNNVDNSGKSCFYEIGLGSEAPVALRS